MRNQSSEITCHIAFSVPVSSDFNYLQTVLNLCFYIYRCFLAQLSGGKILQCSSPSAATELEPVPSSLVQWL